ncbi:PaREP1 family protein [Pyrobaculum sp.]|uniref:PaREP1 family protein n=1 Tax=Pyrobaculum sp. TaxID=2004705 RepID=UPI00315F4EA1
MRCRKESSEKLESLQKRGWYPNYVEADPDDKVELLLKLCEKYLREAEQLTQKGGYVQASEKAWGAAAQIVKAVAAKRGEELKSHGDLWRFVTKLREETGDAELGRLWHAANSLHTNFYEAWATPELVKDAVKDVKTFAEKLRRLI